MKVRQLSRKEFLSTPDKRWIPMQVYVMPDGALIIQTHEEYQQIEGAEPLECFIGHYIEPESDAELVDFIRKAALSGQRMDLPSWVNKTARKIRKIADPNMANITLEELLS